MELDSAFINQLCHVSNEIRKYLFKYPNGVKPLAMDRFEKAIQKAADRNYHRNMSKLLVILEATYGTRFHKGLCVILYEYWKLRDANVENSRAWNKHRFTGVKHPYWTSQQLLTENMFTDDELLDFAVAFEKLINSPWDKRESNFLYFRMRYL